MPPKFAQPNPLRRVLSFLGGHMRFLLLAFLSLPAFAQAPAKEIAFKCDDTHCILSKEDWRWMMESAMAKDKLIAKCGWKST